METKLKTDRKITEESDMYIVLLDGETIDCKVKDWEDNTTLGFHIINTASFQRLIYVHAIKYINFYRKEGNA